ncbi:MAG TPA: amino acid ABC transporter substrate-binding protein, partial [Burkholderiales bacterium]|nr:amino acid ABC transporter substrate-binding protein [Burkholderiales bacterium]
SITLVLAALFAGAVHAQALDGRLKKIAQTKTIAIAYRADAMPFAFADDRNQVDGYSIDLCKRVVNSIERQFNIKGLQIKWVPVTIQSRFEAVAKGRADMECGSSTITLARLKQVDFSSIIFVETTALLVKTASGVRSLSDLSDKKIAVIGGTTNERAINAQLKRRLLNATVVAFKSRDEAFASFEEGKVDAFASDKLLLLGAVTKAKDPRALTLLTEELSFEPYGIVLPRGDSSLRLAVNTGLAQLYSSGQVVETFRRWFEAFGSQVPPIIQAAYILGSIPE